MNDRIDEVIARFREYIIQDIYDRNNNLAKKETGMFDLNNFDIIHRVDSGFFELWKSKDAKLTNKKEIMESRGYSVGDTVKIVNEDNEDDYLCFVIVDDGDGNVSMSRIMF